MDQTADQDAVEIEPELLIQKWLSFLASTFEQWFCVNCGPHCKEKYYKSTFVQCSWFIQSIHDNLKRYYTTGLAFLRIQKRRDPLQVENSVEKKWISLRNLGHIRASSRSDLVKDRKSMYDKKAEKLSIT